MLKPTRDLNSLREQLEAEGVEFLMASFSDMHGVSKTKMVPLAHIEDMMAGSELYTGAALDGVPQDVSDEEVSARPDPASCVVLPWQKNVAWFASNLWCEGKPFEACSRNILARAAKQAANLGVRLLPRTLEEAIDAFEADPLTEMVFGSRMHEAWIGFKREEWSSYHNHVSDWERDRYLKFF